MDMEEGRGEEVEEGPQTTVRHLCGTHHDLADLDLAWGFHHLLLRLHTGRGMDTENQGKTITGEGEVSTTFMDVTRK